MDVEFAGDGTPVTYKLNRSRETWKSPPNAPGRRCIVFYARSDSSVAIRDPLKSDVTLHLRPEEILNGSRRTAAVTCNGLIADWVKWQDRQSEQFFALTKALETLSPGPDELIRPGKAVRTAIRDVRDIPTVQLDYGLVPITHASAGMRRVISFAWLLIWAVYEHRFLATQLHESPIQDVVILFDEVEAHLHPRWQRAFIPSLLTVMKMLLADVNPRIQFIVTTHSPLVLASVEPTFDESLDSLHSFHLHRGKITVQHEHWAKQGDASNWLVSSVFGLHQARSKEAEIAIEAAEAFMRRDLRSLPPTLNTKEAIHRELQRVLASHDAFWPRWIVKGMELVK